MCIVKVVEFEFEFTICVRTLSTGLSQISSLFQTYNLLRDVIRSIQFYLASVHLYFFFIN